MRSSRSAGTGIHLQPPKFGCIIAKSTVFHQQTVEHSATPIVNMSENPCSNRFTQHADADPFSIGRQETILPYNCFTRVPAKSAALNRRWRAVFCSELAGQQSDSDMTTSSRQRVPSTVQRIGITTQSFPTRLTTPNSPVFMLQPPNLFVCRNLRIGPLPAD